MSYLYIKSFIDEQIKTLNSPLVIDDELRRIISRNNLNEDKVKSLLFKCNILIKRHNRNKFNKQVCHQIVQQVAKSERDKILKVNETLVRISSTLQPILLPDFALAGVDRLKRLNELADELPEASYLFALHHELSQNEESDESEEPEEQTGLIVDDVEKVPSVLKKALQKSHRKAVLEELKGHIEDQEVKNEELKRRYEEVRRKLLDLNTDLVYQAQKLRYLQMLDKKMAFLQAKEGPREDLNDSEEEEVVGESGEGSLRTQMTRFGILVENLDFAL